jgi:hypothetical protein
MLLLSFIWQQGVSHLKLNITLCVLEVVVPPSAENLHLQTAVILLGDGSDGISTGDQGIVTIVIGNSRQMQRALLAGSFKIVEDAVLVLEQGFLRIEQSRESVC